MSWIVDSSLTRFQRFCLNVLKCGPLPRHVAFIMDGNRRYASKTHMHKAEGHLRGFDKLAETLQWCLELGVHEVTVYAFSIENFKRSPEEVDTLMRLAEEKFQKLLSEKDRIMREGVCVRVIGNMQLLPVELKKLIAEVALMTKDNTKAVLNVAFAYTSRDEIATGVNDIVEGLAKGRIDVEDVDEQLISECLYTKASPDPDIIVRTSGEVRFSDFLLWQISDSLVFFTNVLWPEFCIWHLLASVFKYQRCYEELQRLKNGKEERSDRVREFLGGLEERRLLQLEGFLS